MKYKVLHKDAELMIVPHMAIRPHFPAPTNEDYIETSDGVIRKIVMYQEIHIVDMEEDIRKTYNMELLDFVKKWRSIVRDLHSMYFVKIHSRKVSYYSEDIINEDNNQIED